jgi:hypothetical protein
MYINPDAATIYPARRFYPATLLRATLNHQAFLRMPDLNGAGAAINPIIRPEEIWLSMLCFGRSSPSE